MCDGEVSVFSQDVVEVSFLLGHEAASEGYWFPILVDENHCCPETSGTDNPVAPRHIPEERKPHICNSFPILSFLILSTTVYRFTTLQVAFWQTVSVNDPHVNQPPQAHDNKTR